MTPDSSSKCASERFAAEPFDVFGCVGLFDGEKEEQAFLMAPLIAPAIVTLASETR